MSQLEDLEMDAHNAMRRGEPVRIDLAGVTYMRSVAVAAIALAERQDGREPVIVGTPPVVRNS